LALLIELYSARVIVAQIAGDRMRA
jgi:hypothetical protein